LAASYSEKSQRRWVCFETNPHIVEDQNAIEGTIEDGLKFALSGVEDAGGLALLAASQNHEASMKDNRGTKGEKDDCEHPRRKRTAIRAGTEHRHKQDNRRRRDEQPSGALPISASAFLSS
jgi:hypothetical protein